mgnify:CR=1 FL=1
MFLFHRMLTNAWKSVTICNTYKLEIDVIMIEFSALITASFLSGKYENLKTGCEDKLHQPFRLPLIPGGEKIIENSYENGALAAYISGAGSTMMAIFDCGNKKTEEIAKEILSSADFSGWKYFILNADNSGTTVL